MRSRILKLPLWREAVRLDEGFYASLIEHPMPVREAAIRQIGGRSMAIDVYIWLAYRLHQLSKPTPISWTALCAQFGAGFTHARHFKAKFREPLALALAAYPEATVIANDDLFRDAHSAALRFLTRVGAIWH
jgi:hypothetical protein